MKKQKTTSSIIESAIVTMAVGYIREQKENIIGIYLSPFSIGGHQKIELVVVKEKVTGKEKQESKRINDLVIFSNVHFWYDYKGEISQEQMNRYKKNKDLKNGYILYDPKGCLIQRQKVLLESEMTNYYNHFDLTNTLVKTTKSKIYQKIKR